MVDATNKALLAGAVVYAIPGDDNIDVSGAVDMRFSDSDGFFSLGCTVTSTYTILANATGHMANWRSSVLPGSSDILVALPVTQMESPIDETATILLSWGPQASSRMYDGLFGTPTGNVLTSCAPSSHLSNLGGC